MLMIRTVIAAWRDRCWTLYGHIDLHHCCLSRFTLHRSRSKEEVGDLYIWIEFCTRGLIHVCHTQCEILSQENELYLTRNKSDMRSSVVFQRRLTQARKRTILFIFRGI